MVRNLCPKVPIIGLTATSTTQVTEDVKKILSIKTALVLKSPLNRPNLFYEVRQKEDGKEYLEKLLTQEFKGQLISKCLFGVIVNGQKKQRTFFQDFCPSL